jgi:hypothetical protein
VAPENAKNDRRPNLAAPAGFAYDLLRTHQVTQFAYVPDAGHRILIDRSPADPGNRWR